MNNTIVISATRWHQICHELKLDSYSSNDRKTAFEDCFNCTVTWRSGLAGWAGELHDRPSPTMVLRFFNPHDAVLFALKWS